MKSDNYMTLCLEQASKSPLHYRHGCIVVRGGKIIGQGFNDHRAGYDGGALKTGHVAHSRHDGPAIAELKQKLRNKTGQKSNGRKNQVGAVSFTPFEGMGGGHQANVPLSMHSEMMAILSALKASGTVSSSALSHEKPCFKLPGHSKRKERLRRENLQAYVRSICQTSAGTGKVQVQECDFEPATSQSDQVVQRQEQKQGEGVCGRDSERQWEKEEEERQGSSERERKEGVSVSVSV